jgi:hypothetical protein
MPRCIAPTRSDTARSTIWGNGSGGTQVITGSLTVGNHADAIVLTLTF